MSVSEKQMVVYITFIKVVEGFTFFDHCYPHGDTGIVSEINKNNTINTLLNIATNFVTILHKASILTNKVKLNLFHSFGDLSEGYCSD